MNKLSSSLFGQLFYLRQGLFTTHGLAHAVVNKVYKERFTVGSMRHSTFEFTYSYFPGVHYNKKHHLCFQSMIELEDKYRELYRFEANQWGVSERHTLQALQDGFVERDISFEEMLPLVKVLLRCEHIVHDSSCFRQ